MDHCTSHLENSLEVKFKGSGQKKTTAITLDGIFKLIMVLNGHNMDKIKQNMVVYMKRIFAGDPKLVPVLEKYYNSDSDINRIAREAIGLSNPALEAGKSCIKETDDDRITREINSLGLSKVGVNPPPAAGGSAMEQEQKEQEQEEVIDVNEEPVAIAVRIKPEDELSRNKREMEVYDAKVAEKRKMEAEDREEKRKVAAEERLVARLREQHQMELEIIEKKKEANVEGEQVACERIEYEYKIFSQKEAWKKVEHERKQEEQQWKKEEQEREHRFGLEKEELDQKFFIERQDAKVIVAQHELKVKEQAEEQELRVKEQEHKRMMEKYSIMEQAKANDHAREKERKAQDIKPLAAQTELVKAQIELQKLKAGSKDDTKATPQQNGAEELVSPCTVFHVAEHINLKKTVNGNEQAYNTIMSEATELANKGANSLQPLPDKIYIERQQIYATQYSPASTQKVKAIIKKALFQWQNGAYKKVLTDVSNTKI